MTPLEQRPRPAGVVDRNVRPAGVERALTIVRLGHTRLGDVIQAVTNLRHLKAHLGIRRLDITLLDPAEHRLCAEILKHDPLIGECLHQPYEAISYADYQLVLHYSVFQHRGIAAASGGVTVRSLPAGEWDLRRLYGDAWRDFRYPFPLVHAPATVFHGAIGDHRIHLCAEERAWAARWLARQGVAADERLIVFVDEASVRDKELHPRCVVRMLERFLSSERTKVLLFDVHDRGKRAVYRQRLRAEHFERIVMAAGNGLRRDLALLADPSVSLIFGPDTGIMHGASAVHAALAEHEPAADRPPIVVYAGRWLGFNMWRFWANSTACCVLPYETDAGVVLKALSECPRDDEGFQQGLGTAAQAPADLLIAFLESRGMS
jgi:hypothetical protein